MKASTRPRNTRKKRNELSLLLFLETRATDYGGHVDVDRISGDDHTIIAKWVKRGFIEWGRISADSAAMLATAYPNGCVTHWVKLSDAAWDAAHAERRDRAKRMWGLRSWKTTDEVR